METVDLTKFCDTESSSYSLREPWLAGEVVYATDGRIVVEVERSVWPDAKPPEGRVPKCDIIFADFTECKYNCPVAFVDCDECGGSGFKACEECGGTGEHECDCGHQHECHTCEGNGRTREPCRECAVSHKGRDFAAHYIGLVESLPNVKVSGVDSCSRMWFAFDGGRGALAAMSEIP